MIASVGMISDGAAFTFVMIALVVGVAIGLWIRDEQTRRDVAAARRRYDRRRAIRKVEGEQAFSPRLLITCDDVPPGRIAFVDCESILGVDAATILDRLGPGPGRDA